jgi:hypothetical protein
MGVTVDADVITARESLMGKIVSQISDRGYYLADFDPGRPQALVDLRWAAQMAGRLIGCRTETHASAVGKRLSRKVTVVVVVVPANSNRDGWGFDARVRSIVEDLLRSKETDQAVEKSA